MIPEFSSPLLVVVNAAATLYMMGLIWVVQVVHYPLFDRVGRAVFAAYESDHTRLITLIVGPPMLIEAATSAVLALAPPRGVSGALLMVAFLLVLVAWGVTALFSVPSHGKLARGFDEYAHRSLVRTNWLRTAAWTVRSALTCVVLYQMISSTSPEVTI